MRMFAEEDVVNTFLNRAQKRPNHSCSRRQFDQQSAKRTISTSTH